MDFVPLLVVICDYLLVVICGTIWWFKTINCVFYGATINTILAPHEIRSATQIQPLTPTQFKTSTNNRMTSRRTQSIPSHDKMRSIAGCYDLEDTIGTFQIHIYVTREL